VGVIINTCGAKVLLMERKEALLKGMWVFPLAEEGSTLSHVDKRLNTLQIKARFAGKIGEARHVFTHRIWQMTVYHYVADACQAKEGRWASLHEMNALPLPTAIRAAKEWAVELLTPEIRPILPEWMEKVSRAYSESWRSSHAHHCSPAFVEEHTPLHMEMILRGHLDTGKDVYAIFCAREAAGVLVLDQGENELVSLYLHPNYQNAGVGKAAVRFAVENLKKERNMRVTVLEDNQKAQHIYQSAGFTKMQERRILNKERNVVEMDLIREGEME